MRTSGRFVGALLVFGMVALIAFHAGRAGAMARCTVRGRRLQRSTRGTGSVGDLQFDPIVERGTVPSMHMHEFFGSTAILSTEHPELAAYGDLVDTATTCDIGLDSALYWIPLLSFKTGAPVPLARMDAYYFAWNGEHTDPTKTTRMLPSDLRTVAGNSIAASRYQMDRRHVYWDCGASSTKSAYDGHWATPAAADCATAQPIDGGKVLLTLAVTFPSCWDGILNDHTRMGTPQTSTAIR